MEKTKNITAGRLSGIRSSLEVQNPFHIKRKELLQPTYKKTHDSLVEYIYQQYLILKKNPHLLEHISDGVRNNIFYMTHTKEYFTGMFSYKAYRFLVEGGKRTKLCKEHHYSLLKLTKEILTSLEIDLNKISEMIKCKATWNYTTSEENVKLKKFEQSYNECGIELQTWEDWQVIETRPSEMASKNSPLENRGIIVDKFFG